MGKFDELDQDEQEKRKKAQIELRNKKKTSRMFIFFGSIFEIIETLFIIVGLFVGFAAIFSRILPDEIFAKVYTIVTVVIFFGGLFLGFLVYRKVMEVIIEKFNLRDKLTNEVLLHYDKLTREQLKEAKKR